MKVQKITTRTVRNVGVNNLTGFTFYLINIFQLFSRSRQPEVGIDTGKSADLIPEIRWKGVKYCIFSKN